MTDRVYPSTKQNGTATHPTAAAAAPPIAANPPSNKAHLYIPTRHPYRPTPTTRQRRKEPSFSCRRCCCLSCFWSFLILIAILLLAAIAAAAFYELYHPHRPDFSFTSLKISSFNLTTNPSDDSTHITTKINVTLSAKNPNKKFVFIYDPISIAVLSNSVKLSNGSFVNFVSPPDNITVIHASMGLNSQLLDADSVNSLKSDLKKRNGLPMEIVMDTMVGVKMEKMKMKKIGIRVKCGRIHAAVPKGKNVTPAATTSEPKCKVDLRIKILRWTF